MNEHNSLPNMRFKGFTDKWEQEKLGNIATVEMNKRIYKNQTNEKGEIPFYKIGTFGKKADSFISNKLFNEYKKKYPYPKVGDILISASGTIGNTIIYKGEDAYFQDSNIVWLNINHNIILNSFLYSFYQIVHWRGIEGSTIKRLYNSNILSTPINYPSVNEQQKIGNLFAKLDKLLDLQQQKIDKLELLKKALLQGLFPKHDVKVPELRFNGYKKNWEKDLIGNVSTSKSGGTPSIAEKEYYDGNIPFIRSSDINKSRTELCINDNAVKHSSTFIVEKGSILYALYGATSGQVALSKVKGAINQAVLAIFPKNYIEKIFLMYWFIYSKKRIVSKYLQGGQGNLSAKIIKNLIFCFPNKSEQQKIGNLLSKVDQLIELENKKLQNFQQVKKCLLQNMFVE